MFLFEKKIIYLTFYWDGIKKSSAGFAKISRETDIYRLDIHIKHIEGLKDGKYALYLMLQSKEAKWESITVKDGAVNEEKRLVICHGKFRLEKEEFDEDELCGILIQLDQNHWISGCWQEKRSDRDDIREDRKEILLKEADSEESRNDIVPERTKTRKSEREIIDHVVDKKTSADYLYAANKEVSEKILRDEPPVLLKPSLENKWEQLQRVYKGVHPFGDERLYLTIEPKDFIVLQAPFQRLVNNSFLLHGYYNYRHLILGPDEEIGAKDEICYYLGVPGTYFEREKMVAVMFGFEGFECAGPVEVGKFGYYMRRVEL